MHERFLQETLGSFGRKVRHYPKEPLFPIYFISGSLYQNPCIYAGDDFTEGFRDALL